METINTLLTSMWFILGVGAIAIAWFTIAMIPGIRHVRRVSEYIAKYYPVGAQVIMGERKAVIVRHGHLHLGQVYVLPMDPGASEVLVEITALKPVQSEAN